MRWRALAVERRRAGFMLSTRGSPGPRYRACMVNPYRDHLRARRAQEPGVGATVLLGEIRARGLQRQPESPRAVPEPGTASRRACAPLATPGRPAAADPAREPHRIATRSTRSPGRGCPEMTARPPLCVPSPLFSRPTRTIRPSWRHGPPPNARQIYPTCTPLPEASTRAPTPSPLRSPSITTTDAPKARTEGVHTKTTLLKRQMYGRAGFALLRHRILLG